MLDDLIKGKSPKEILGQDAQLDEPTKRLVERALEGELTDHLGYEKHACGTLPPGAPRSLILWPCPRDSGVRHPH